MPIVFEPATMEGLGLWVSISGGSRSGKTVSALRLAKGIAGKKPIFAIDTEGKRMSHHAKRFRFQVYNMSSPFHPIRFAEAAEAAEKAGAGCVVADSFSLAWNGIGGVLDIQREELARIVSAKMRSATYENEEAAERARGFLEDRHSDAAWVYAKGIYREMRDRMMQLTTPIVFCSRLNPIPKRFAGNKEGRWKVEGDEKWLYEWTVALTLKLPMVGRPDYTIMNKDGEPLHKVGDLGHLFPPDRFIGEAAGEALAAWRRGETPVLRDEDQPAEDRARDNTAGAINKIRAVATVEELREYLAQPTLVSWLEKLKPQRPELYADIQAAQREAFDRFLKPHADTRQSAAAEGGEEDDGWPGPDVPAKAATSAQVAA
jgi:hypothetical protein